MIKSDNEYPFSELDRVSHIKEPGVQGTVTFIDRNLSHPTTCGVLWDDSTSGEIDIQWTNKLVKQNA